MKRWSGACGAMALLLLVVVCLPPAACAGIEATPRAEALADAILRLYRDPDLRASLGEAGCRDVEEFAMLRVARRFLREVAKIAPGIRVAEENEVEHAS